MLLFISLLIWSLTASSQKISIRDTIFINQCDPGNQGLITLNIDSLKYSLLNQTGSNITPTIYLSTSGGNVIKIIDLYTTPSIVNICSNSSYSFTDIAINSAQEIYVCSYNAIYKINPINGSVQLFYQGNTGDNIVALSFDTKDNLYFSINSVVYRFNKGSTSKVVWHDFGTGNASGDFVMKNGKMYISWYLLSVVKLYEVIVDNNINFLSYTIKCNLRDKTYGLASELGVLYGVTPTNLYKIDETNCTLTTIIGNNSYPWYGAAGLHEAQSGVSAHLNYADAQSLSNAIAGKWTNTIPYNQLIYITIDDKIKDSLLIFPVKIHVIPIKKTNLTKQICKGSSFESFTVSGIYTNKFTSAEGCDSIRTLHLSVVDKIFDTIRKSICENTTFKNYSQTGVYTENYTTATGCDSILTIMLQVNKKSNSTINKTICKGKTYLNRTQTGTYVDILTNYLGCDSIRTLNLNVISISKPVVDIYACINPGNSFRFLSKTITAEGIYIDSTNHPIECDTIFRLHVSKIIPFTKFSKISVCQGTLVLNLICMNDTLLKTTFYSILGCDSIYDSLQILVQKTMKQETIFKTYCDTFIYKNVVYNIDRQFVDTTKYVNSPFCDSLRQLYSFKKSEKPKVQILTPQGTICTKGESIELRALGALYFRWNTFQTVSNIKITPLESQEYYVIGEDNNLCIDTAKIFIEVENVVDFDIPSAFSPNGDDSNDIWQPNSNGKYEIILMEIFNRWGEKVFKGDTKNSSWDGNYKGDPAEVGVYVYQIIYKKNRKIFEKKGSLTLLK